MMVKALGGAAPSWDRFNDMEWWEVGAILGLDMQDPSEQPEVLTEFQERMEGFRPPDRRR